MFLAFLTIVPTLIFKAIGDTGLVSAFSATGMIIVVSVALEIDKEVRQIIESCYAKAKEVLQNNQDLLKTIAEYLLLVETLTKSDIDEINTTGHLKWVDEKFKEPEPEAAPTEESSDTEEAKATEEPSVSTSEEAKTEEPKEEKLE